VSPAFFQNLALVAAKKLVKTATIFSEYTLLQPLG